MPKQGFAFREAHEVSTLDARAEATITVSGAFPKNSLRNGKLVLRLENGTIRFSIRSVKDGPRAALTVKIEDLLKALRLTGALNSH